MNKIFIIFFRKYKKMVLVSLLFFYLGCGVTFSLLRTDCDEKQYTTQGNHLDTSADRVEYAVLVLTGPDNISRRDTIRATWANFAGNIFEVNGKRHYKWNHTKTRYWDKQDFVKTYFVLGTKKLSKTKLASLHDENHRSKDLLLLDSFEDGYETLTIKVLHALQWFKSNLKRLKYVIKCDDDSFVRIDLIVRELETFAPAMNAPELTKYVSHKKNLTSYKGLYWGYFHGRANVYLGGKWEERDWFLCDKYLPYALGGGYVISYSIVDYVARNADFLSVYKSEDVSMGVWTAALDGINRVHDIRFDTQWKSFGCVSNMMIKHKQSPTQILQIYNTLVQSRGTKLCETESISLDKNTNYYIYNWNALPSSCCNKLPSNSKTK